MSGQLTEPVLQDGAVKTVGQAPAHHGGARRGDAEFFAEPSREIGTLISADSTLRKSQRAWPLWQRVVLALVVGVLIVGGLSWWSTLMRDGEVVQAMGYLVGIPAAIFTIMATRFKKVCTYVGEDGIERCTLTGSREAKPRLETLVFAQAAKLIVQQTKRYVNGAYVGTSYDYSWFDDRNHRVFRVKGSHRGGDKGPKPGDMWYFASMSELAWSQHFLDRAADVLAAEGSISFPIEGKGVVRVGAGFIEFNFGGKPVRLTRDELATISLSQGYFSFKHKDAKWYSLSGKYGFQYRTMANGRVFLLSLERLLGWRF